MLRHPPRQVPADRSHHAIRSPHLGKLGDDCMTEIVEPQAWRPCWGATIGLSARGTSVPQPPDLRFAPFMDIGFAVTRPLAARVRLISGSCSSARAFAPRFFRTPPHGRCPCASLPFTSKLSNVPGTPGRGPPPRAVHENSPREWKASLLPAPATGRDQPARAPSVEKGPPVMNLQRLSLSPFLKL